MGIQKNGQVIWGASKSFRSHANPFVFSNPDNFTFWVSVQCSEWPILQVLAKRPSVQVWADMYRPQEHASPVARAQKPQASKLLVRPHAGGLHWGQKWG